MNNNTTSIKYPAIYPSEAWSECMGAANYNADRSITIKERRQRARYMYNRSHDEEGNYTKPTSDELQSKNTKVLKHSKKTGGG